MLKLPLISFIVTSYNYEKFIIRTLESIKSQSYKNFEIIIIDDKSTDNSVSIIENFISQNQNIRILLKVHETNKGQMSAFQTGLREAHGQFISFIDSDDILMKDFAQAHLRIHMATSVAFTSAQIIEIDENENIHTIQSISSPQNEFLQIKNLNKLLDIDVENIEYKILNTKNAHFGGWYWSPNSSAMFRKSSIEILTKYQNYKKWKICPDKFLFNFANLIGGSAIIYAPLVAYRRHGSNAGDSSLICGDKKLHSDKTTIINVKNNIKIRPDTINFLWQNRNFYGKRNTVKLILTVLLSYIL